MKCPKCKEEIENEVAFCGICGFKIHGYTDEGENDFVQPQNNKKNRIKEFFSHTENSPGVLKRNKKLKFAGISIFILIIVMLTVYFLSVVSVTEGERVLKDIPLGRNIEYISKETGVDFIPVSEYSYLGEINRYNYIFESKKNIKIEGINLPEWAVMLSYDSGGIINLAAYYDFTVLIRDWKGVKKDAGFDESVILYGMNLKETEKAINIPPYTIIMGIDNQSTYVYRYNKTDSLSGNTNVFNLYVVFDDVSGEVTDAYSNAVDFGRVLLNIN